MTRFLITLLLLLCSLGNVYSQDIIVPRLSTDTSTTRRSIVRPKAVPYDSTKNWLGSQDVASYVGETLYVNGRSESLRGYGYRDFYDVREPGTTINNHRWGHASEKSQFNTKYEDLVGKYFVVRNVQPDSKWSGQWWFYLQNRDNIAEYVWYEYNGNHESDFPFVTVAYYEYLKKLIGTRYVLNYSLDDGVISTRIHNTDYETGERITERKEDRWECIDVIIDGTMNTIIALLKNQEGAVSYVNASTLSNAAGGDNRYLGFKEEEFNRYVKKYGAGNMDTVRQGRFKMGWSQDLLLLSWGPPERINSSSHGPDQWVYSNQYIYIQNGKITAWN